MSVQRIDATLSPSVNPPRRRRSPSSRRLRGEGAARRFRAGRSFSGVVNWRKRRMGGPIPGRPAEGRGSAGWGARGARPGRRSSAAGNIF